MSLSPVIGTELLEELELLGVDTAVVLPESMEPAQVEEFEKMRDALALRGTGRTEAEIESLMGWPAGQVKTWRKKQAPLWGWALADSIERANRLTGYVACQAISLMNQAEVAGIKMLYRVMTETAVEVARMTAEGNATAANRRLETGANAARGLLTYAGRLREHAIADSKVDAEGKLRPALSAEFLERLKRSTPESTKARISEKRAEVAARVAKHRKVAPKRGVSAGLHQTLAAMGVSDGD